MSELAQAAERLYTVATNWGDFRHQHAAHLFVKEIAQYYHYLSWPDNFIFAILDGYVKTVGDRLWTDDPIDFAGFDIGPHIFHLCQMEDPGFDLSYLPPSYQIHKWIELFYVASLAQIPDTDPPSGYVALSSEDLQKHLIKLMVRKEQLISTPAIQSVVNNVNLVFAYALADDPDLRGFAFAPLNGDKQMYRWYFGTKDHETPEKQANSFINNYQSLFHLI
ncbi:MAG: hypothetical protein D6698_07415 [Gammaproteobacteria bacterium]|nr:MAG: hypothetical protein D6698_07415 [Gammaproteobacteria bacterium]